MKKSPLIALLLLPLIMTGCNTASSDAGSVEGDPSDFNGYYANTNIYDPLVEGTELQTELHNLMIETHSYYTLYSDCLPKSQQGADLVDTTNYKMEFFWSGTQVGRNSSPEGLYYDDDGNYYTLNREHVWPKSRSNGLFTDVNFTTYNDAGAGSDCYHIRPVCAETNSAHWAYRYGTVDRTHSTAYEITEGNTTAGWVGDNTFEPKDEFKGDVARILLYVYMHYSNAFGETNKWCGSLGLLDVIKVTDQDIFEAYRTLIEWNNIDPVSDLEKQRNEYLVGIQGNRNPFVDYPSLVERMLVLLD